MSPCSKESMPRSGAASRSVQLLPTAFLWPAFAAAAAAGSHARTSTLHRTLCTVHVTSRGTWCTSILHAPICRSKARNCRCSQCAFLGMGNMLPARHNDVWFETSNNMLRHINPDYFIKAYRWELRHYVASLSCCRGSGTMYQLPRFAPV